MTKGTLAVARWGLAWWVFTFAVGPGAAAAAGAGRAATLREAAAKHQLLVGAAVMSGQLDDPPLAALVAAQFSVLTAENEMKPESLEPVKDHFTFARGDKIVAFAQAHGMKVVGHNLCWHQQTPAWMFQSADGKPLPREQALRNLREHIDNVVRHYKGRVIGWDVVNEAISDDPHRFLRDTPARRAIGDDYIEQAFEFAHAADPDAELYYNDYGNENPAKRDKTVRLIRQLKGKRLRIDAVGLQCHWRLQDSASPRLLDEAITAYAAEGVKCMVTELDVDVLPHADRGPAMGPKHASMLDPYKEGLPAAVAEAQAEFYRKTIEAVLRHPGQVTRITFWGTHDGSSWLNDWPGVGGTNYPLLWDRQLRPKPAFRAVLDALNVALRS